MKSKTVNVRLRLPRFLHGQVKSTAAIQQRPLREFLVIVINRGMMTFRPKTKTKHS